MAKYTEMAKGVLKDVGGLENIKFVEHCATRLRIHYYSKSKVDFEAIKKEDKVVGLVEKTGQIQIIIGPEVNDAYNEFLDVSGFKPTEGGQDNTVDTTDEAVRSISELEIVIVLFPEMLKVSTSLRPLSP